MATEELAARVDATLAAMTLEQKCALLAGATAFGTRAYPELGIPELQFSDGPHGMRHQGEGANHLGIGGSLPATCFPTAVTVANSWDPALGEELGAALGEEAATQGVAVVLGPGLNIKRSPLCGRNFEYFSEDPLLAGKVAAGYVRGIQSQGVAACPKHFAVNSQEMRRQASDSVVDERTLRELYLAGFETVVREAHPQTIMTSYNLVNGTYANENPHLLQEILRDDWGFDGAVVTDWGGSNDHVAGVAAGSTFEMPAPGLHETRKLVRAVKAGELAEADVDARVREALTLILGTRPAVEDGAGRSFDVDAHHELARRIAAQGIVLLKNDAADSGSPLLPLAAGTRVALIGDFAKTPRYQGAGSSLVNCTKLDNLVDVLTADPSVELVGYAQGFDRGGAADAGLAQEAAALAAQADVALVCLGLDELAESEGIDRTTIKLHDNQLQALSAVAAANPNVAVLLSAGSQVETVTWAKDARSIVYLALGGQAGASAAADVLTGRVNPGGKLAETWVRSLSDTPTAGRFPAFERTSEYREGLYVGYRYHQTAGVPVSYPFGFGLSYTSFAYSDLRVIEPDDKERGRGTQVVLTLTNAGERAGAEVVQLYVGKPEHEVFRPESQLAAFAKVALGPGESREVTLELDERAFRFWNVATNAWEVESGTYELRVGASSEDIRLVGEVDLAGSVAPNPYADLDVEPYRTGRVAGACVSDAQFAALLGHALPAPEATIDESMCFRDLTRSRSLLLRGVGGVLGNLERKSMEAGTPDLNIEFIYNMPLRAIGIMAGGMTSGGLVKGIVAIAKGWGWCALAAAILVRVLIGGWLVTTFVVLYLLPILVPVISNFIANAITERKL